MRHERFLFLRARALQSEKVDATDSKGNTALNCAAQHGHLHIVQYLCGECRASVDTRSAKGATALVSAAVAAVIRK